MIELEINKVLAQMRSIAAAVEPPPQTVEANEQANFGEMLRAAIDQVNTRQDAASRMATDFEMGTTDASVAEVMVAMQKASLSFQAMTEVRNKLVDAYHEIMNMPI